MSSEALQVKYRPQSWKTVIGQDAAVASLSKAIERAKQQSFILTGPSGTGKTTLARIAAKIAGCDVSAIVEIDAATHTGIDAMRAINEMTLYKPFGESKKRTFIIDEAHALSKQAWQSLLKAVEEPPSHVLWFFCTTEATKIPVTIKTRCAAYNLKLVKDIELETLLEDVCLKEKIKLRDDIVSLIVSRAEGSPRQLLVNLEMCRDCVTKKQAADLLQAVLDSNPVIELCRFLLNGGTWSKAMRHYEALADENPEGVRIVVVNYMGSVLKGSKSTTLTMRALHILEQFSTPYNASENAAPLLLSMGRTLFAE